MFVRSIWQQIVS